jgi:signal transduction histidine kinase
VTADRRTGSLRVRLLAAFALVSVSALGAFVIAEGLGVEAGLDALSPSEEATSARVHAFLYRWGLASGLVALAVAAVIARWMVVRITRPLDRLRGAAEAFSEGDRSARAGLDTGILELDALAGAFDTMADAVARAEDSRTALIADIAHELRNPLTVVRGRLEEMRDGLMPADVETLGAVHDECLRLSRVAADLAELARSPAAAPAEVPVPLQCRPVNLAELVRTAVAARAGDLAAAGLRTELDLAPAEARGDPERLSQVVGNVLDNCARYAVRGGLVRVRVYAERPRAEVTIDDSGPGMSPWERAHACERSYRGSHSTDVPGSGLGLAVARQWAVAHDGSLSIEPSELGGTRVRLVLPVRQNEAEHWEPSSAIRRMPPGAAENQPAGSRRPG